LEDFGFLLNFESDFEIFFAAHSRRLCARKKDQQDGSKGREGQEAYELKAMLQKVF
jgi:hypothetical protein